MKRLFLIITLVLICCSVFAGSYSLTTKAGVCVDYSILKVKYVTESSSYDFGIDLNYNVSEKVDAYVGLSGLVSIIDLDFSSDSIFIKNNVIRSGLAFDIGLLYSLNEHYKIGAGVGYRTYILTKDETLKRVGLNLRFDGNFEINDKLSYVFTFNKFIDKNTVSKIKTLRDALYDLSVQTALEIAL